MIKLTAKINLSEAGGNIASNDINTEPNNIGADVDSVLNVQKDAKSPFIIGFSTLGDGSTYESSLDYYMGSVVSNENKAFDPAYVLTVEGAGVESLTIVFDAINQQYPTSIIADGETYNYKADYKYTVKLNAELSSHTITIANWNVANAPMVITGIYASLSLEFDYDRLISITANHLDRATTEKPAFGPYSNSGDIKIIDSHGEIKRYAEKRVLKNGLKLTITLKNTLTDLSQVVGVYETEDWDYDYVNNEAVCSLNENILNMQDIDLEEKELDDKNYINGEQMYNYLLSLTPERFNFKAFDALSEKTKQRLESTSFSRYYFEPSSLWARWEKFGEVVQAHIYQNFSGETEFEVE